MFKLRYINVHLQIQPRDGCIGINSSGGIDVDSVEKQMLQHVYKDSVKFGTQLMLICGKLDDMQETVPIKK